MSRLLRVTLLIAFALAPATGASAADGWQPAGVTLHTVVSDGARFAIAAQQPGQLRVYDDRTAFPRTLSLPDGCASIGVTGAGRAVLVCRPGERAPEPESFGFTPNTRLTLIDLVSGATTPVPLPRQTQADLRGIDAVGARWMHLRTARVATQQWTYLRLADGRTVREPVGRAARAVAPDLDARTVLQPLCAPLRRPANVLRAVTDTPPPVAAVSRSGEWLGFLRARERTDGQVTEVDAAAWRCGDRTPRRLVGCTGRAGSFSCTAPLLGSGLASFRTRTSLRVVRLRDGRELRYDGRAVQPGTPSRIVHTRRRLFVSSTNRSGEPGYRMSVRMMPRRWVALPGS